jgi:hypothetical protein
VAVIREEAKVKLRPSRKYVNGPSGKSLWSVAVPIATKALRECSKPCGQTGLARSNLNVSDCE